MIYKCDDVMEMNRRERRRNNLAAGVTNYFGTGLDFCLTQPHNTFPDLRSYWLCGKVDRKSGKLIPKTFPGQTWRGVGCRRQQRSMEALCQCGFAHMLAYPVAAMHTVTTINSKPLLWLNQLDIWILFSVSCAKTIADMFAKINSIHSQTTEKLST